MVRETRYLWVGNLPEKVTEDQISEHFKRHGKIQSVKIHPQKDGDDNTTAGSCTVAFMDIKSASKAHNAENRIETSLLRTDYSEPTATGSVVTRTHEPEPIPHAPALHRPTFPLPRGGPGFPGRPKGPEDVDRPDYHYGSSREGVIGQYDNRFPNASNYEDNVQYPNRGRTRERPFAQTKGSYSKPFDRGPAQQRLGPQRHSGYDGHSGPTESFSGERFERSRVQGTSPGHSSVHSKPSSKQKDSGVSASRSPSRSQSRSSSSSSYSGSSSNSSGSRSRSSSIHSSPRPAQSAPASKVFVRSDKSESTDGATEKAGGSTDTQSGTDKQRLLGICIRRLPLRSSDTSLRDGLFHEYKKHGKVTAIQVSGQSEERYAIVSFRKYEDACKALEASHDKLFFGAKIQVVPHEGLGEVEDNEFRPPEAELDEYHPKATRTLFVGNLEKDITTQELRDQFKCNGEIIDIDVKRQGAVSAYAFVQYADITSVVKALRSMDGEHIGPNKIKLGFGKSMPTNCVWLDNVAETTTERFLCRQFSRFGSVSHSVIDKTKQRALVYFEGMDTAQTAVNEMRNRIFHNKKIQIDFASRDCQTKFFEKMERTGQLRQGERPDERGGRIYKQGFEFYNEPFREDGGSGRGTASTTGGGGSGSTGSFEGRSPGFAPFDSGGSQPRGRRGAGFRGSRGNNPGRGNNFRGGRGSRGGKGNFYQEGSGGPPFPPGEEFRGERRPSRHFDEEFSQGSGSYLEDSYEKELWEYGFNQRARGRGGGGPRRRGDRSPSPFFDRREGMDEPYDERFKEGYPDNFRGSESPRSQRDFEERFDFGPRFFEDSKQHHSSGHLPPDRERRKDGGGSRDHSVDNDSSGQYSRTQTPVPRSDSLSPPPRDRQKENILPRAQTPPTPTQEEPPIYPHGFPSGRLENVMDFEQSFRDTERSTKEQRQKLSKSGDERGDMDKESLRLTSLAASKPRLSSEIGMLPKKFRGSGTGDGFDVGKFESVDSVVVVKPRKRSHEESEGHVTTVAGGTFGKLERQTTRTSAGHAVRSGETFKSVAESVTGVKNRDKANWTIPSKQDSTAAVKKDDKSHVVKEKGQASSCSSSSPGSEHGENELSKLQREKWLLLEKLKQLEEGGSTSDNESTSATEEDIRRVVAKRPKLDEQLTLKKDLTKLKGKEELKIKVEKFKNIVGIDVSQSYRKQMEARRRLEKKEGTHVAGPPSVISAVTRPSCIVKKDTLLPSLSQLEVEETEENMDTASPTEIPTDFFRKKRKGLEGSGLEAGPKSRPYRTKTSNDIFSSGDEKDISKSFQDKHFSTEPKKIEVRSDAGEMSSGKHFELIHLDRLRGNEDKDGNSRTLDHESCGDPNSSKDSPRDKRTLEHQSSISSLSGRHSGEISRDTADVVTCTKLLSDAPEPLIIPCTEDSAENLCDPRQEHRKCEELVLLPLPMFALKSFSLSPASSPHVTTCTSTQFAGSVTGGPKLPSPCFSPNGSKSQSPMMSPTGHGPTDHSRPPVITSVEAKLPQLLQIPELTEAPKAVPELPTKAEAETNSAEYERESTPMPGPQDHDSVSEGSPEERPPSPTGLTMEERIRLIDEKMNLYNKYKRKKKEPGVNSGGMVFSGGVRKEPSDMVRSLLNRSSIFDQDSKRLEQINEKYEPKDHMNICFDQIPGKPCRTKAAVKEMPTTLSAVSSGAVGHCQMVGQKSVGAVSSGLQPCVSWESLGTNVPLDVATSLQVSSGPSSLSKLSPDPSTSAWSHTTNSPFKKSGESGNKVHLPEPSHSHPGPGSIQLQQREAGNGNHLSQSSIFPVPTPVKRSESASSSGSSTLSGSSVTPGQTSLKESHGVFFGPPKDSSQGSGKKEGKDISHEQGPPLLKKEPIKDICTSTPLKRKASHDQDSSKPKEKVAKSDSKSGSSGKVSAATKAEEAKAALPKLFEVDKPPLSSSKEKSDVVPKSDDKEHDKKNKKSEDGSKSSEKKPSSSKSSTKSPDKKLSKLSSTEMDEKESHKESEKKSSQHSTKKYEGKSLPKSSDSMSSKDKHKEDKTKRLSKDSSAESDTAESRNQDKAEKRKDKDRAKEKEKEKRKEKDKSKGKERKDKDRDKDRDNSKDKDKGSRDDDKKSEKKDKSKDKDEMGKSEKNSHDHKDKEKPKKSKDGDGSKHADGGSKKKEDKNKDQSKSAKHKSSKPDKDRKLEKGKGKDSEDKKGKKEERKEKKAKLPSGLTEQDLAIFKEFEYEENESMYDKVKRRSNKEKEKEKDLESMRQKLSQLQKSRRKRVKNSRSEETDSHDSVQNTDEESVASASTASSKKERAEASTIGKKKKRYKAVIESSSSDEEDINPASMPMFPSLSEEEERKAIKSKSKSQGIPKRRSKMDFSRSDVFSPYSDEDDDDYIPALPEKPKKSPLKRQKKKFVDTAVKAREDLPKIDEDADETEDGNKAEETVTPKSVKEDSPKATPDLPKLCPSEAYKADSEGSKSDVEEKHKKQKKKKDKIKNSEHGSSMEKAKDKKKPGKEKKKKKEKTSTGKNVDKPVNHKAEPLNHPSSDHHSVEAPVQQQQRSCISTLHVETEYDKTYTTEVSSAHSGLPHQNVEPVLQKADFCAEKFVSPKAEPSPLTSETSRHNEENILQKLETMFKAAKQDNEGNALKQKEESLFNKIEKQEPPKPETDPSSVLENSEPVFQRLDLVPHKNKKQSVDLRTKKEDRTIVRKKEDEKINVKKTAEEMYSFNESDSDDLRRDGPYVPRKKQKPPLLLLSSEDEPVDEPRPKNKKYKTKDLEKKTNMDKFPMEELRLFPPILHKITSEPIVFTDKAPKVEKTKSNKTKRKKDKKDKKKDLSPPRDLAREEELLIKSNISNPEFHFNDTTCISVIENNILDEHEGIFTNEVQVEEDKRPDQVEDHTPAEKIPWQAQKCMWQTEKTPRQTEKSPRQAEKSPRQAEKSPCQAERSMWEVETTPHQTDKSPWQAQKSMWDVEKTPPQSDKSPRQVQNSMWDIEKTPWQTEKSPEQAEKSMWDVEKTPRPAEKSPRQAEKSMWDAEETPLQAEKSMWDVEKPPQQTEKSMWDVEKTPLQTENSVLQDEKTPQQTEKSMWDVVKTPQPAENSMWDVEKTPLQGEKSLRQPEKSKWQSEKNPRQADKSSHLDENDLHVDESVPVKEAPKEQQLETSPPPPPPPLPKASELSKRGRKKKPKTPKDKTRGDGAKKEDIATPVTENLIEEGPESKAESNLLDDAFSSMLADASEAPKEGKAAAASVESEPIQPALASETDEAVNQLLNTETRNLEEEEELKAQMAQQEMEAAVETIKEKPASKGKRKRIRKDSGKHVEPILTTKESQLHVVVEEPVSRECVESVVEELLGKTDDAPKEAEKADEAVVEPSTFSSDMGFTAEFEDTKDDERRAMAEDELARAVKVIEDSLAFTMPDTIPDSSCTMPESQPDIFPDEALHVVPPTTGMKLELEQPPITPVKKETPVKKGRGKGRRGRCSKEELPPQSAEPEEVQAELLQTVETEQQLSDVRNIKTDLVGQEPHELELERSPVVDAPIKPDSSEEIKSGKAGHTPIKSLLRRGRGAPAKEPDIKDDQRFSVFAFDEKDSDTPLATDKEATQAKLEVENSICTNQTPPDPAKEEELSPGAQSEHSTPQKEDCKSEGEDMRSERPRRARRTKATKSYRDMLNVGLSTRSASPRSPRTQRQTSSPKPSPTPKGSTSPKLTVTPPKSSCVTPKAADLPSPVVKLQKLPEKLPIHGKSVKVEEQNKSPRESTMFDVGQLIAELKAQNELKQEEADREAAAKAEVESKVAVELFPASNTEKTADIPPTVAEPCPAPEPRTRKRKGKKKKSLGHTVAPPPHPEDHPLVPPLVISCSAIHKPLPASQQKELPAEALTESEIKSDTDELQLSMSSQKSDGDEGSLVIDESGPSMRTTSEPSEPDPSTEDEKVFPSESNIPSPVVTTAPDTRTSVVKQASQESICYTPVTPVTPITPVTTAPPTLFMSNIDRVIDAVSRGLFDETQQPASRRSRSRSRSKSDEQLLVKSMVGVITQNTPSGMNMFPGQHQRSPPFHFPPGVNPLSPTAMINAPSAPKHGHMDQYPLMNPPMERPKVSESVIQPTPGHQIQSEVERRTVRSVNEPLHVTIGSQQPRMHHGSGGHLDPLQISPQGQMMPQISPQGHSLPQASPQAQSMPQISPQVPALLQMSPQQSSQNCNPQQPQVSPQGLQMQLSSGQGWPMQQQQQGSTVPQNSPQTRPMPQSSPQGRPMPQSSPQGHSVSQASPQGHGASPQRPPVSYASTQGLHVPMHVSAPSQAYVMHQSPAQSPAQVQQYHAQMQAHQAHIQYQMRAQQAQQAQLHAMQQQAQAHVSRQSSAQQQKHKETATVQPSRSGSSTFKETSSSSLMTTTTTTTASHVGDKPAVAMQQAIAEGARTQAAFLQPPYMINNARWTSSPVHGQGPPAQATASKSHPSAMHINPKQLPAMTSAPISAAQQQQQRPLSVPVSAVCSMPSQSPNRPPSAHPPFPANQGPVGAWAAIDGHAGRSDGKPEQQREDSQISPHHQPDPCLMPPPQSGAPHPHHHLSSGPSTSVPHHMGTSSGVLIGIVQAQPQTLPPKEASPTGQVIERVPNPVLRGNSATGRDGRSGGSDQSLHERTSHDRVVSEREAHERSVQERANQDRANKDRANQERTMMAALQQREGVQQGRPMPHAQQTPPFAHQSSGGACTMPHHPQSSELRAALNTPSRILQQQQHPPRSSVPQLSPAPVPKGPPVPPAHINSLPHQPLPAHGGGKAQHSHNALPGEQHRRTTTPNNLVQGPHHLAEAAARPHHSRGENITTQQHPGRDEPRAKLQPAHSQAAFAERRASIPDSEPRIRNPSAFTPPDVRLTPAELQKQLYQAGEIRMPGSGHPSMAFPSGAMTMGVHPRVIYPGAVPQQHGPYLGTTQDTGMMQAVHYQHQHYLAQQAAALQMEQRQLAGSQNRPPSQPMRPPSQQGPTTPGHPAIHTNPARLTQSPSDGCLSPHIAIGRPLPEGPSGRDLAEVMQFSVFQKFPVSWQGVLALKNDSCIVQMHFLAGNPNLAKLSLPQPGGDGAGGSHALRIAQRMRLEPVQLDGVAKRMQLEEEYCMLLAIPSGRDHHHVMEQTHQLTTGFIQYLQQKQAAGIVNVAAPGSQMPAYVVHIFPPCEFSQGVLSKLGYDFMQRVNDIAHMVIIVATV